MSRAMHILAVSVSLGASTKDLVLLHVRPQFSPTLHPTTKESTMTTDAIRIATDLADQLATAWNAADGESYGAVFTDDASFVDIRGDHHRSRRAIGRGHHIAMEAPAAPLPPNDGSMASFVVVNDGGTWRIASFHNTLRLKRPAEHR